MDTSTTTRIRVTDPAFDCEDCANTIERVLLKSGGVEDVAVDDRERELEVRFDRSVVTEGELERLVEEWGYGPDPPSA